MLRANIRLIRRILAAVILLGLLLCGAEVGVRVFEVAQGGTACTSIDDRCLVDPTGLTVPSWITDRELKPHSSAEVKCHDRRRTIVFKTNSQGIRCSEIAVPKPAETYRIVILGDETILAPEIPDEEHFANLLSRHLQQQTRVRIEVINAAIPGACPLTEYLLFKQKLLAVQPDLVLMHFDWSDVCDDRQLRRQLLSDQDKRPLSCPNASLVKKPRKPNSLETLRQHFRLIDGGLVLAGRYWKLQIAEQTARSHEKGVNAYAWLRDEHPENDVNVMQSFRPIEDLARLAGESFFQFVVLTSPKPWQVSVRCTNGPGVRLKSGVTKDAYYPNPAPFSALESFVGKRQIAYLDLSASLMQVPEPESSFLRYAPRWSPEGQNRVADFLARFLIERVSGPWNSRYFQQNHQNLGRQRAPSEIRWASGIQRNGFVD